MQFAFADRADAAYHSLEERDQKRVQAALSRVMETDVLSPSKWEALKPLRPARDKTLWVLKVSPQLRLIASIDAGVLRVEDIVPRDRLDRVVGRDRG